MSNATSSSSSSCGEKRSTKETPTEVPLSADPVPRRSSRKRAPAAWTVEQSGDDMESDDGASLDIVGEDKDDDDDDYGIAPTPAKKKRLMAKTPQCKYKNATPMATLSAKATAVPSSMKAYTASSTSVARTTIFEAEEEDDDDDEDEGDDSSDDEDDDMQVDQVPSSLPMTISSMTTSQEMSDDEEVESVGSTSSTGVPHMRQYCPVREFIPDACFSTNVAALKYNTMHCRLCYCFVCDVPASRCTHWSSGNEYNFIYSQNHCHASNTSKTSDSRVWKRLREAVKTGKPSSKLSAPKQKPKGKRMGFAKLLEGSPFPPTDEAAANDPRLTQCRHCKHYNAFAHVDFLRPRTNPKGFHPEGALVVGSTKDWCQSCGRLPSDKMHRQTPTSTRYREDGADIFCAKRKIPFRIESHDPRQFPPFQERWESKAANAPSWLPYDAKEMDHDNFWHRLGSRPTLSMIADALPSRGYGVVDFPNPSVLMDGSPPPKGWVRHPPSATEKVIVHLDNEEDRVLLEELAYWGYDQDFALVKEKSHSSSCPIGGDILASWNKEARRGTFTVRFYLRRSAFVGQASSTSHDALAFRGPSLGNTLRALFGMETFPLADLLHGNAVIHHRKPQSSWGFVTVRKDDDDNDDEEKDESTKERIDALNKAVETKGALHSFRSTSWGATRIFGGVSSNDTSWKGTFRRFYSECLPFEVAYVGAGFKDQVFAKRGMRDAEDEITPNSLHGENQRPCSLHSHVRNEDCTLLKSTDLFDSCCRMEDPITTFPGLFSHLENLGHTAIGEVPGLRVELFDFQRQAVQFAMERENVPGGIQRLWWTELPQKSVCGRTMYYSPVLDKVSLTPPRVARGGIIAQEMGLGKTIITLALLLSNPAPEHPASGTSTKGFVVKDDSGVGWSSRAAEKRDIPHRASVFSRGTLVVCNVSLVGQWVDEAKAKLKDPGLVYCYYGSGRKRNKQFLSKCAIVVTTYQTLASDATYHAKKAESDTYCPPLEQIYWHRVVIDESHTCKHQSNMTKMLLNIEGENKWAVSGTPINTSINDLRNQLKYIGIEHVDAMFDRFQARMPGVAGAAKNRGKKDKYGGPANAGPFFFLMRSLLIRHSMKQKTADGSRGIMELPPKEERSITITFSEEERKAYDELETKAQKVYKKLKSSRRGISRQYLRTMAALQPLRMACSGGKLVAKDKEEEEDDDDDEKAPAEDYHMTEDHGTECSICLETLESPVATICHPVPHVFCRECITGIISAKDGAHGPCPLCRDDVQVRSLRRAVPYKDDEEEDEAAGDDDGTKPAGTEEFVFRSKLDRLLLELGKIRDEEPKSKSLVFTQFKSTLEWLKEELPKNGFKYRSLSGGQQMSQRAKALRDFQNDPPTTVFLLSLRAGAVGINLTQANRVFILEPAFNPALEAQAIGRVHRMGQKNNVKIIKFRMDTSVETRLAKFLTRKYGSGEEEKGEGGDGKSAETSTLVAGSLNRDKMSDDMIAGFDLLFGC